MWMMRLTAAAGLVLALASCGDNQSPYEPWILDTLTPAEGLWIRTPEFDVAPGAEIQYCYFFQVPAQTDGTLWVDRVELALNAGSHHMNLFRVKTLRGLKPEDGSPVLLEDMKAKNLESPVVVSPDIGGVVRARAIAKLLDDTDIAIIDKRRPKANVSEVMNIIGEVEGRTCIIMDDMVDTAGTLCKAATALKANGAKQVVAYCTHPVLSGPAVERVNASDLDALVVTDTIPLRDDAAASPRIRQLSVAEIMAETIRRISNDDSVSSLFID